ncbi:MAG: hypothetical protein ACLU9S_06620 [Oscillospiraceae bacterium]
MLALREMEQAALDMSGAKWMSSPARLACMLFALICLLNGQGARYFKTAIPVYMMALYFLCFYTRTAMPNLGSWYFFPYCFMFFTLATVYALAVDGKIRHFWVLLFIYLLPLAFRTANNWGSLDPQFVMNWVLYLAPDSLFLLGLILAVFATWIQNDGKYHATWGDRPDGRRLRTLYPMSQISPYIMVTRNSSTNFFSDSLEISAAERYIRQKRREGLTNFGLTHALLAAYVRTVAKLSRPQPVPGRAEGTLPGGGHPVLHDRQEGNERRRAGFHLQAPPVPQRHRPGRVPEIQRRCG